MMNTKLVEFYRRHYPEGTTIELENAKAPYPVEPGTRGKVQYIDGRGVFTVKWEDGTSGVLIPSKDTWKKIREPLITKDEWVPVLIAAPILIPMGMFILIKLIEAL